MTTSYGSTSANGHSNFGIREVELVQTPMDCVVENEDCKGKDAGRSFFFKINGEEVYMRGANMVPMDFYPSRMYN